MKRIIISSFILLFVIYAGCAICAYFNLFDWDTYFKIVAIVGGLASVLGLLGVVRNPLKDADIQNFKAKSLRQLAQTAEEIEKKQATIADANKQISSLQLKKEELEILVEQASLSLYYKNEIERSYNKLYDIIKSEEEINRLIINIRQLEEEAKSLNGEIEGNDEIKDVIATIQKAKEKTERTLEFKDIIRSLLGFHITVRI